MAQKLFTGKAFPFNCAVTGKEMTVCLRFHIHNLPEGPPMALFLFFIKSHCESPAFILYT